MLLQRSTTVAVHVLTRDSRCWYWACELTLRYLLVGDGFRR